MHNNRYAARLGGSRFLLCIAVVIAAVVINLLFGLLPETLTKPDVSSSALYTLSEETERLAGSLEEQVDIYLIAPKGGEDGTLTELLGRYKALSKNLTVETVDPADNPTVLSGYESLPYNSLIVQSQRRTTTVSYNDIYYYQVYVDGSYIGDCAESEFQSLAMMYYSYYGVTPEAVPMLNAEGALSSAINYVTMESIPQLYLLSGHGEAALDTVTAGYLDTDNIDVTAGLKLLTAGAVPQDADAVIINAPTADLTAEEATLLRAYLQEGGDLILLSYFEDCTTEKMPNLTALLAEYGMQAQNGMIVEGHGDYHYPNSNYILMPKLTQSEVTAHMSATDLYVIMPNAHGIALEQEPREGLTLYSVLTTSTKAYLKEDPTASLSKEEGDVTGPFTVAAAAQEGNTQILWFASPGIEMASYDVSGGNSQLFLSGVHWVCDSTVPSLSIATKPLQIEALTMPEMVGNILSVVAIAVVPLTFIVIGAVVLYRRKKG